MHKMLLVCCLFLSGCSACSDSPEDLEKLARLRQGLDKSLDSAAVAAPPPEGFNRPAPPANEQVKTYTYSCFYDGKDKSKKYESSLRIVIGEQITITRDGQSPVFYAYTKSGNVYYLKNEAKEWNTPLYKIELKLTITDNAATFAGKTTRTYEK